MDNLQLWEEYYRSCFEKTRDGVKRLLHWFQESLAWWLHAELNWPRKDWEQQLQVFVEHSAHYGVLIKPKSIQELHDLLEARVNGTGPFERFGPYRWDEPPQPSTTPIQLAAAVSVDDGTRSDAAMAMAPEERPSGPANADGIDPDDYTKSAQQAFANLGADWKDVSIDAMHRLVAAGLVIEQSTNGLQGVDAFVRLARKDGGVDTARFRLVRPWFSPPHWEFVEIVSASTPQQEAAKLAAEEKIRHADVMRVRGAMVRAQGAMFAIVGGILEGAPLLGTLEAVAGAEQGVLAGKDLATGKVNRAWSTKAVQAALEAAGVDEKTAAFLAENGGLLVALGKAGVDAAGTAHAVIETSTGYRIQLEFDKATLSTGGLGGAKMKVTRLAPDGTEIKPVGNRFPINSKYAGKVMPAEALPANIRAKYPKGVPFTSEGFPNFSDYAVKTVKPKGLTGNRDNDNAVANAKAGYSDTPNGYTWHHHEDGVTMQLVPTDLHDAVRHTGGSAVIRHGS